MTHAADAVIRSRSEPRGQSLGDPESVAFERESYQPEQEASVVSHAGPIGDPGSETFHTNVVTLTGLAARVARWAI